MSDKTDMADVLVIGAGMSGGAFTWSLSEAGIRVTCLEQGDWPIPSRYPSTHDDWELHIPSDYHFDPNVRGLPEDYPGQHRRLGHCPVHVQRRRGQRHSLGRALPHA